MTKTPPVDPATRQFDREDAQRLRPGDEHYLAYVGPPRQYDYMGATQFRLIQDMFGRAGLVCRRIPWFHPRQVWYLGARDPTQLPDGQALSVLTGAVLRDPEFRESVG